MKFYNPLHAYISKRWPTVVDFRVDHFADVVPIDYFDCGRIKQEYPPVACWRVGNTRYRYVGKPNFVEQHWRVSLFSGVNIVPEYKDAEPLFTALELSVAGHDSKYINEVLTNMNCSTKML